MQESRQSETLSRKYNQSANVGYLRVKSLSSEVDPFQLTSSHALSLFCVEFPVIPPIQDNEQPQHWKTEEASDVIYKSCIRAQSSAYNASP